MKQLSLEEKQTVQTQLQAYVSKYPSQNKAVNSLGLSTGTVSAILNGKFDNCLLYTSPSPRDCS